jgi:septal ring factor EnvC (AmiA/AmiB activator)
MSVLEKVQAMKAQVQAQVDAFSEIESELQAAPDTSAVDADLTAQLEKAKEDSAALVAERDALRAAIQTEIDDRKKDTERLEATIAPLQQAPAPVIPDAPAQDASPAPSDSAPSDSAPSQDAAPSPDAPTDLQPGVPAENPAEDPSQPKSMADASAGSSTPFAI